MENRSHALIAGLFTLVGLALAIATGLWLGRDQIQRDTYQIATRLAVNGLNVQAAVRYKGLKVGSVSSIAFDPAAPGQILLTLQLDPDTPITQTTTATLSYQGVTGIASILLDDLPQPGPRLAARDDTPPRIPLKAGLFQELEQRGLALLAKSEAIGAHLEALLDPHAQNALPAQLARLGAAADAWRTLAEHADPALRALPATLAQGNDALRRLGDASDAVNRVSTRLDATDGPLSQFQRSLSRLDQQISQDTLPELHALTRDARRTLRTLNSSARQLQDDPQRLLFGPAPSAPDPGEPGHTPPVPHGD